MAKNSIELPKEFEQLSAPIQLYVKEESDNARNQALGVFGFIAVVFGVLNFVGLSTLVSISVTDQLETIGGREITDILDLAEERLETINALNSVVANEGIILISSSPCPEGWEHWRAGAGQFLRGLDPTGLVDPDGPRRILGDTQTYATARPIAGWNISSSGDHTHTITGTFANGSGTNRNARRGNGDVNPSEYNDSSGVGNAGLHTHEITGGDIETRPKNISVLYCVRSN